MTSVPRSPVPGQASEEAETMLHRVFVGPEPDVGPHPGFKGEIVLDGVWVHIPSGSYALTIADVDDGSWPDSEWDVMDESLSIPASAVDAIQWDFEPAEQAFTGRASSSPKGPDQ